MKTFPLFPAQKRWERMCGFSFVGNALGSNTKKDAAIFRRVSYTYRFLFLARIRDNKIIVFVSSRALSSLCYILKRTNDAGSPNSMTKDSKQQQKRRRRQNARFFPLCFHFSHCSIFGRVLLTFLEHYVFPKFFYFSPFYGKRPVWEIF